MRQSSRLVTVPGDIMFNIWTRVQDGKLVWFWRLSTWKSGDKHRVVEAYGHEASLADATSAINIAYMKLTGDD